MCNIFDSLIGIPLKLNHLEKLYFLATLQHIDTLVITEPSVKELQVLKKEEKPVYDSATAKVALVGSSSSDTPILNS